ncbi:MAG: M48 family metallopeptidase [Candidatus Micrarchaeia archaeon]
MGIEYVSLNGYSYAIEMVRTRNKNAYARLVHDTIFIRIPYWLSEEESANVYEQLKRRILKRMEIYKPIGKMEFADGCSFTALGSIFSITIMEGISKKISAKIDDTAIRIKVPSGTNLNTVNRFIIRKLSKKLHPELKNIVEAINAKHFGVQIDRVAFRNNTRLWGSYSIKHRSISINLRLAFAPYRILEYVVVHELAHAKEHSHSRAFWNIVESILPDYKERKEWLAEHGNSLSPGYAD